MICMEVWVFRSDGKLCNSAEIQTNIPMNGYRDFYIIKIYIFRNYTWFDGYDRFIDFKLH